MQILKDIRKKQIIKNSNILESLLDRFSPKKQYVNIADSIIVGCKRKLYHTDKDFARHLKQQKQT